MGVELEVNLDDVVVGGSLMHSDEPTPDFSGYATKAGLKCSDGRTILPDAFKHQDKETVPLVWQHGHNEPGNVLGYAVLENREDGVYTYGYFNDTPQGQNSKTLVQHKDIKSLSIYANGLIEKAKQVFHGTIREVSLVLSGANPGALIDFVTIAHADGETITLEDEAVIYTGLALSHADGETSGSVDEVESTEEVDSTDTEAAHSADNPTVQEVYDSMTTEQQEVVHYMVGVALENKSMAQSSESEENDESKSEGDSTTATIVHDDKNNDTEGRRMSRNVFEDLAAAGKKKEDHVLSHDGLQEIVADARKVGSLKEAFEQYAFKHGIDNIDVLFPDAKTLTDTPEFDQRRVEWVAGVLSGTRHSPFSRIKTIVADLTFDEARAKGYIKGNLKKEEFFGVSKRSTTPSTVYKKQKLDRDDIIDITDFDVVVWLKAEMRLMLDEELARAVLIGDGRAVDDDDKIRDPAGTPEGAGIRSILNDHDLYAGTVFVDSTGTPTEVVDGIVSSMGFYKGSGSPTFFTTLPQLTSLLLARDELGHRLWRTAAELASEMGVGNIVVCEVMEDEEDLIGIIVNLKDYTLGSDKGGDVNFFDDFDIDYNQYKYLLETRLSGALTKIRSALVIKRAESGDTLVAPEAPEFDGEDITVPSTANVTYKKASDDSTVTGTVSVAAGETITIYAVPDSGYYFQNNVDDQWTFTNRNVV